MKTLVVTIAGPERKVDLTVPAETPIEQLLPTFLSLGLIDERTANGGGPVSLARAGEPPLPPSSTLAECGVVDGTLLQVQVVQPEEKRPPEPEVVDYEDFEREQDEADLKRRAGFPLQRTRMARSPTRRPSASASARHGGRSSRPRNRRRRPARRRQRPVRATSRRR